MIPMKSPRGSLAMNALTGQVNGITHHQSDPQNRAHRPIPFHTLLATNAVVGGLEIAASVAFTYIPPMLLKIGFAEAQMTILFGIAPFLALVTVPAMGRISDRYPSKYGRRRPFIMMLSVILIISLICLSIGQNLLLDPATNYLGMVLIAVNVVLLDYASQAAINPCESLMADMLHEARDPEAGYLVYSGMLSAGSCVGFFLSTVDWGGVGILIGSEEQTAFILVLILFVLTLAVTMVVAKEVPLDETATTAGRAEKAAGGNSPSSDPLTDNGYSSESDDSSLTVRVPRTRSDHCRNHQPEESLLAIPTQVVRNISGAPKILQRLFVADLLSWMAVMAHVMFCTDFVATVVYRGRADAAKGSQEQIAFDEGVRMGSLGLLLHSITAFFFAFFCQNHLVRLVGLRSTYLFGLASFAVSMLFTVLYPNVVMLNICAAVSGIGFTVITTVPNTLVSLYHSQRDVYFRSRDGGGYGEDISILDTAYYLSQVILSLVMGKLVEVTGKPELYMAVASLCGFAAVFSATKVAFSPMDVRKIA